jgi:membrane fusion protein (multidrug efflux system)
MRDVFVRPRRSWASHRVFSFLLAACGAEDPPSQQSGALPVRAQRVESRPLPLVLEAVGRTEGSREIELRARVSGILEEHTYEEGAHVKAGDVLFRIDPAPYEVALAHAKAALAQERATQQQAKRNAERLSALAKQNAVSKRQADDAVSALEAANAAVLAAEAKVREAQLNLSYTRVTTPIAGIAGRAVQSEGSLVTAGTESSLLTTVAQTDPIWVRFALSVQEHDALRKAGANDPAALKVELLDSRGEPYPVEGRINFAGSTVDPTLGTVQLRAEFPNPDLAILPGEYLRVRLTGGESPGIAVPQTAVLQGSKGPYVWVVDEQGLARQRNVATGAWIGEDWRITAGLVEGDTVILDNLLKLRPGLSVAVELTRVSEERGEREPGAPARASANVAHSG